MKAYEQSVDLLAKLRAAKATLEDTGAIVLRGEGDAPPQYTESEVYARYISVWWMLTMAINDIGEMTRQWSEECEQTKLI